MHAWRLSWKNSTTTFTGRKLLLSLQTGEQGNRFPFYTSSTWMAWKYPCMLCVVSYNALSAMFRDVICREPIFHTIFVALSRYVLISSCHYIPMINHVFHNVFHENINMKNRLFHIPCVMKNMFFMYCKTWK